MKKITKLSTALCLAGVLALPVVANAAVIPSLGVYWPSYLSVTRSSLSAGAESRGPIIEVGSEAEVQVGNKTYILASDTGRFWSKINTQRPGNRSGVLRNYCIWSQGDAYGRCPEWGSF